MSKTKIDREVQAWQFGIMADAIERELELRKDSHRPKANVYVVLRHVSRSGMQRVIDLKVIDGDGDLCSLTLVGADDYRFDYRRDGYVVGGCGMDMGFALIDNVAHRLRKWCEDNGRGDLAIKLKDWQSVIDQRWA